MSDVLLWTHDWYLRKQANAMEDLVGHPSNIPLHVGLHGEESKTPRLGAGLCTLKSFFDMACIRAFAVFFLYLIFIFCLIGFRSWIYNQSGNIE